MQSQLYKPKEVLSLPKIDSIYGVISFGRNAQTETPGIYIKSHGTPESFSGEGLIELLESDIDTKEKREALYRLVYRAVSLSTLNKELTGDQVLLRIELSLNKFRDANAVDNEKLTQPGALEG